MICNHCDRDDCATYAEDGGITAICSVTGKIIDDENGSGLSDSEAGTSIRSKQMERLIGTGPHLHAEASA